MGRMRKSRGVWWAVNVDELHEVVQKMEKKIENLRHSSLVCMDFIDYTDFDGFDSIGSAVVVVAVVTGRLVAASVVSFVELVELAEQLVR